MTDTLAITLIGLGEVGTVFASELLRLGIPLTVASRPSARAAASAERLGIAVDHDLPRAVGAADLVLLTVTGDALGEVADRIAGAVRGHAIVADLTSASPRDVMAASKRLGANGGRFVDVAIMGAVSLHGIKTPLLAAGEAAAAFARDMNALGFAVSAREDSHVGDASKLKLLRSLFAKGLDALVVESMMAAEASGLREQLIEILSDFDERPLRDHVAMYLRTHPPHSARRLVEMELAEAQLESLGIASLTTRAAIARYRRTAAAFERDPVGATDMSGEAALRWLLDAERRRPGPIH